MPLFAALVVIRHRHGTEIRMVPLAGPARWWLVVQELGRALRAIRG